MFKSKFLPVFTFLFIAVLASCNFNSRKTSSIYLDLSGIKAKVIGDKSDTERKLIDDYTDTDEGNIKPLFVDIEITEGVEFKETIDLHKQVTLEIAEVPVGTRVKAKIDVYTYTTYEYDGERQEFYFEEASKNILYSGESKPRVISGGPNSIIISMKELTNKIYVTYNEEAQDITYTTLLNINELSNPETNGKTPETGFHYIQSAINWISENGSYEKDYEIILTGYGEETPFIQCAEFGNVSDDTDNLSGKAKSITLTSDSPYIVAVKASIPQNFTIATHVPVIFKNIIITSSESNTSDDALIFNTRGSGANITLDYGTQIIGLEGNHAGHGAVLNLRNYATATMKGNATISGFDSTEGGAVYLNIGTFIMQDNSRIENCTAQDGGAVYSHYENNDSSDNSISISGNASITGCTATSSGGAFYLKAGDFSFSSGCISECSATQYGGAIYIDASKIDITSNISGGEIKDNTAGSNGKGIYLNGSSSNTNGDLHLSENAFIDPSNDIYLTDFAETTKLYLDSELTTEAETAALITLFSYSEDSTIINCAEADNLILEKSFSKFCVSPSTETIGEDQIQHNWYINEEGQLKEVDYILEEADPVQLGDLVFADNTRVRPENYPYLTYQMRTSLAGIVFYAGTEDDLLGAVNLMVGTKTYNNNFTTLTKISNNGDTSFDLTQVENFPTYAIPATGDTEIIQKETSSTLPISEATFATGLSTGNTSLTEDIIDRILNGYSMNGNNYPLYKDIINYGALFSDSLYSTNFEENFTNNWYIPTIPEYTLFAQFLNNYSDLYKKLCGEIRTTYISATSVKGQGSYPQSDTGNNVYHYAIDTENQIIKCVSTSGYYYYNSIPIHTYSLN